MNGKTARAKQVLRDNIDVFDLGAPSAREALDRALIVYPTMRRTKANTRRRALRAAAILLVFLLLCAGLFSVPPVRAYILLAIERATGAHRGADYFIDLDRAILRDSGNHDGQYQTMHYEIDGIPVELFVEPLSVVSTFTSDADVWRLDAMIIPIYGWEAVLYQDVDCVFAVIEQADHRTIVLVRDDDMSLLKEILHVLRIRE